jgi:hypothetical protein
MSSCLQYVISGIRLIRLYDRPASYKTVLGATSETACASGFAEILAVHVRDAEALLSSNREPCRKPPPRYHNLSGNYISKRRQ